MKMSFGNIVAIVDATDDDKVDVERAGVGGNGCKDEGEGETARVMSAFRKRTLAVARRDGRGVVGF